MGGDTKSEKLARKEAAEIKKLFKAIATRGDQTALEDLFYQFSGRIKAYAHTLLIEKDSCEDVTTEVFMKIAYLETLTQISNPVGWMYCVTKNLCYDFNRRVKYHQNLDDVNINNNLKYSATQTTTDFDRELAMLQELQREIVLLEVIGNMSQRDISEHLHITRAQVRKEREIALEKLDKVFDKRQKDN